MFIYLHTYCYWLIYICTYLMCILCLFFMYLSYSFLFICSFIYVFILFHLLIHSYINLFSYFLIYVYTYLFSLFIELLIFCVSSCLFIFKENKHENLKEWAVLFTQFSTSHFACQFSGTYWWSNLWDSKVLAHWILCYSANVTCIYFAI